jgi:hypothetical protein
MDQADSADVVDELVTEEVADEPQTEAAQDAPEAEATEEAVSDEVVVTIGEESPPSADEFDGKPAPVWVKDLRKQARELARENRELKQKLHQPAPETAPVLPPEPTLEKPTDNPDDAYDPDAFKRAWVEWNRKKESIEAAQKAKAEEQAAQQREWQEIQQRYQEARVKAAKSIVGFEDAEEVVLTTLPEWQQQVILDGAEMPERLVAYIGNNPSKAKELPAIKRFGKFAFAVAKLEDKLKVTPRTSQSAPPPERVVRGHVAGAAAADNVLEKLREEAARTLDFTKVAKYKDQLRKKQT